MELTLSGIDLQSITKPLKKPFKTSLQTVTERESIVVRVKDDEGREGFGECVAFSTPWYTEETISSCRFVLQEVLIPLLIGKTLESPDQVMQLIKSVKGNHMAKAAVEMAVWDLFAKKHGQPLWQFVGGTKREIPAGVVVATDEEKMAEEVAAAVGKGYKRIKMKITPFTNQHLLAQLIAQFPEVLFFADANGGFSEETIDLLLAFDSVGFSLIEQPFGEAEWQLHATAKRTMKTPICLDESLRSVEDVQRMIDLKAGDIAVLKMGRLGGWSETLKAVNLCHQHNIKMWVGGMIEFGVSKAHNLALASLKEVSLPGDFSDSAHFWYEDIIEPEIKVDSGNIILSESDGIGYNVKWLKKA